MPVVVLPDVELPHTLVKRVIDELGPVLFRHPTGSAWIVGTTGGRRIVSASNGDLDVVLIGNAMPEVDEEVLARRLRGMTSVRHLDELAGGLAEGDVIFLARESGHLRCQAPLFLTASLFWARVDGVDVICDEQLPLQQLGGLSLDRAVVASRLTDAELSYPFGLKSVWHGINTVGPGEWLSSTGVEAPRPVPWWRPPEPAMPVQELSERLRTDIAAALLRRTAGHQEVSADLSGGIDSTTLNYFLAALGRRQHTLFFSSTNVANNDHIWADRAVAELGTTHVTAPYSSVISVLLDKRTGSVGSFPEGPGIAATAVAAIPMIESLMAGTGSTLHLNGHAGDALFGPLSTMLWSLVHSRGKGRFRRAWRHRVANRYPLGKTLRMVARQESFSHDLARIARSDFLHRDDLSSHSRWAPLPNVHPALTEGAREQLRQLAAAVRRGHHELSEHRTTHQILQYLIVHGNIVRRMNLAASPGAGIRFDSPYLDRRIVESCLSLRIGDRAQQYPAKPLLAAARPPGMSLDYFRRPDKGDYTAEVFQQHQALRPVLKQLFADGSALEDIGLVSVDRIMRSINEFSTDGRVYIDLVYIAFAERWLRSAGR